MFFVVVLLLVIWGAVAFFRLRRRSRQAIVMTEESGELVISRRAFCEFVREVVDEYPLFHLVDAWFVPFDDGFRVKLRLRASADAELSTQHKMLSQRVADELRNRLGLDDKIKAIDLMIVSLAKTADASKAQ